MNRDYNQDNLNEREYLSDYDSFEPQPGLEGQQMTPPRFVPGMPGRPMTPPPGGPPMGPGMQAPRTPPPNFIPQPPEMERAAPLGEGRGGFGVPFRPGRRVGPRELRRCINSFTFIWLINGSSFWFFPIQVDRQFILGFRWRRNRWEFERINVNRILFFRCF